MRCELIEECAEGFHDSTPPKLPEGVPPLRSLYIYLTDFCNLRCKHCWITPQYTSTAVQQDSVDLGSLRRIVKDGKGLGLSHIKLTGGEPLLHPGFLEVIQLIKENNLRFSIETNGTLLTPDIVDSFKTELCSSVSVSLDSHLAADHDEFRGKKGAFHSAVEGVRLLVNAGVKTQIIMSLHKDNIDEVEDMVALAQSLNAHSVKFNPVTEMGRALVLKKNGKILSYDELLKINELIKSNLQPKYLLYLVLIIPPAFSKIRHFFNNSDGRGTCGILGVLGILGTGHYALCGVGRNIEGLCFGKIEEKSLFEVWTSHPILLELRKKLSDSLPGICGDCIHSARCLCNCVAYNYNHNGQLVSPDSMCEYYEKRGGFPVSRRKSTI